MGVSSHPKRSPASIFAPILVAIVETAVVAPLLALLDELFDRDGASASPNVILLGVVGLIAFAATRWLQRQQVSLRVLQLLLISGIALVAVTAPIVQDFGPLWNPDEPAVAILASVAAAIAWWRGMQYGSDPEPFGADRITTLVKVSWVALVAQVLLIATADGAAADAATDALRVAMPVAVVAGLVLLALGQIEQARVIAARRGGRAPERRGWMTYAFVFAIGLLLIAVLGSAVLGDTANWVLEPLGWLLNGVIFVLSWVLYGVVYAIFILLYPLIWLLERLRADPQPQEAQTQGEVGRLEEVVNNGADGLPAALQTAIEIGAVVLLIAIVLVGLALTLRRVRPLAEVDVADEERESLWSRDLAMTQLKGMFRRGHDDAIDRIDLRRPPASVRDAYRALQALAQRDGVPRREAETPAEFSRRLSFAWPGQAAAIGRLTRSYERVRYGGAPDDAELAAARDSWQAILQSRSSD